MLAAAEAANAEEDVTVGKDKRGDEMPDWAGDKQKRLAKIQQAMASLKPRPSWRRKKSAGSRPKKKSSARPQAARSLANRRRRHQRSPIPRRNATSLESRIMKSKDGFVQAYNAQAAADAHGQIIVAHDLTQCGSDQGQ
ncbi:hypothetical protein X771_11345 [Mesorhizobium sp. LSJC277A00]|nr:hypothetical protein X771_11345 [Mesorhizobium sp. LSJC277A00]